MEYQPNTRSITSESAPLIEPIDSKSDQELFMVPLKRPSPRLSPSRYRNVKPRTPPRSPKLPQEAYHRSPPLSGGNGTMKPSMYTISPFMSPETSSQPIYRPSTSSMVYNSPPMSSNGNGIMSSSTHNGVIAMISPPQSQHNSPNPQNTSASSSNNDQPTTTRTTSPHLSTKASSIYDSPPPSKPDSSTPAVPAIPPLSSLRNLKSTRPAPLSPSFLAPPIDTNWTVPDSPLERLSQLRATRDSAYDRAREMEIRRSEWKHVVYRFPVKGAEHRIIDCDLTESSHARLADVARRSSEGFEWNGEVEYAEIYRVLYLGHLKVMGEMRMERVSSGGGVGGGPIGHREVLERLRAAGVGAGAQAA
ncbi:hypothetical protein QBC38DRAFT_428346 [Podospora fimiseda]|uniref:Uncharacterized protein n=1 Tax=Podospora fimiseda TaxID=252190 RepID=A0AAN6YPR0_9PEZI|nr:hypothetical protein QBC38DRAFT_428346 [Podospora fimiseda]